MRYLQKAWQDTKNSLGGLPTVITIVFLPMAGLALHLFLQGPEAMSAEAYVWIVYGLAPLGAAFAIFFLWNLACAPYRIQKGRADSAQEKVDSLTQQIGFDSTPEYVAGRQQFSLVEAACLLGRVPLRTAADQGPSVAYMVVLKEKIVSGEIGLAANDQRSRTTLSLVRTLGIEAVPDNSRVERDTLSAIADSLGIAINGLNS